MLSYRVASLVQSLTNVQNLSRRGFGVTTFLLEERVRRLVPAFPRLAQAHTAFAEARKTLADTFTQRAWDDLLKATTKLAWEVSSLGEPTMIYLCQQPIQQGGLCGFALTTEGICPYGNSLNWHVG